MMAILGDLFWVAAEKGQQITSSSEARLSSREAVANLDKDKINKFISHEEACFLEVNTWYTSPFMILYLNVIIYYILIILLLRELVNCLTNRSLC